MNVLMLKLSLQKMHNKAFAAGHFTLLRATNPAEMRR